MERKIADVNHKEIFINWDSSVLKSSPQNSPDFLNIYFRIFRFWVIKIPQAKPLTIYCV